MAVELSHLDLAERGECAQANQGDSQNSSTNDPKKPFKYLPPPLTESTGRTGSARHKQNCREWCFFPACERQFSLVLDYWAAKSWDTYYEIELLEHNNRDQNREDYKEHRPDNEYGERKEELMERLTEETKVFLSIFNLANGLMLQHQPSTTSVNEYRQWSHHRLAPTPDPTDYLFAAENYRALGSRPSMIDEIVHSFVKGAYSIWSSAVEFLSPQSRTLRSTDSPLLTESMFLGYGTLYVLSHVFITILAILFFVVPLAILYLVPMPVWATVVLAATFSMVFCVGSFYFGGGGLKSDHKFLLLFAYMSVMATLLSNLHSSS